MNRPCQLDPTQHDPQASLSDCEFYVREVGCGPECAQYKEYVPWSGMSAELRMECLRDSLLECLRRVYKLERGFVNNSKTSQELQTIYRNLSSTVYRQSKEEAVNAVSKLFTRLTEWLTSYDPLEQQGQDDKE